MVLKRATWGHGDGDGDGDGDGFGYGRSCGMEKVTENLKSMQVALAEDF